MENWKQLGTLTISNSLSGPSRKDPEQLFHGFVALGLLSS